MGEFLSYRRPQEGCTVNAQVCRVESPHVTELYLNLRPVDPTDKPNEAAALYGVAVDILRRHKARIFSERIFAAPGAIPAVRQARTELLGDLGDGVPATALSVPKLDEASIAGVQIHAISGPTTPEPVCFKDEILGRRFENAGRSWLHLSGLTALRTDTPESQARAIYELASDILHSLDMDFRCVARTWIWLCDILEWYDEFNAARTTVYQRESLVDDSGRARYLPASTGIGVAPANGGACALELIAVSDGDRSIRSIQSGGEQDSAFSYGSAFARAVAAPMPAGQALFISGTAAIDAQGRSEYAGEARSQIDATMQHVRALLGEAGWNENRVVSAIAYSKTPEIARLFADEWSSLPWPRVETVADVCRDELLFEVEVTAAEGAEDCTTLP